MYTWKKAPFIRLLIPIISGILIQWNFPNSAFNIVLSWVCYTCGLILFSQLPLALQFKIGYLKGILIYGLTLALGMLLTYQSDPRYNKNWFATKYHSGDYLIIKIGEALSLKPKSYKTTGDIIYLSRKDSIKNTKGKTLIYFALDSAAANLQVGDEIIIHKKLQEISNPGNPGGFDYAKYCAFRQIYHQVFLKMNDWQLLKSHNRNMPFLLAARKRILSVLKNNMAKDDQLSIAEALLIGYTDDLDKDLVQAYSNTGVVHIIAISGMHIGLVYAMLFWIFNKIPYLKKIKILRVIFLLTGIWMFALLTGGCPSILRAAVMFSFVIIGKALSKRSNIYNSLAASAFVLLCYNPYFLWDVGFQLSYLALAGIVIFQRPVYKLWFIKNKWLNKIWELTSVSLAAQILTFPICLYYFHQFPLLFLFTNLISVPLSTLILFVEIIFIGLGWLPIVGFYLGKITWFLVFLMNRTILFFNSMPSSVITNISIGAGTTLVIYITVLCVAYWLFYKNIPAFKMALVSMVIIVFIAVLQTWKISHQNKIIVYNIPHRKAIDLISGNSHLFLGDTASYESNSIQTYTLKPAGIMLNLTKPLKLNIDNNMLVLNSRKVLLIDSVSCMVAETPLTVDLVIISCNPNFTIRSLMKYIHFHIIIFDSSNNLWKIAEWEKECEELHLPSYSVPAKGAFILDL